MLMQTGDVATILREMLLVVLKCGGPPLLAALVVGLVISLVQAVTQINETTLVFVPKVIAIAAVLTLLGAFMFASLSDFSTQIFDRLVAIGGS
jgi:flagellar biosynthetic protein FliQ